MLIDPEIIVSPNNIHKYFLGTLNAPANPSAIAEKYEKSCQNIE